MEGFSCNLSLLIRDLVVIYFLKSIVSHSSVDFPWAWLLENARNELENIMLDGIPTDFMLLLVYEKNEHKLFKYLYLTQMFAYDLILTKL